MERSPGGNFDIVVSGGLSLQPHMGSFLSYRYAGLEGYGLSETSPVIAVSRRVNMEENLVRDRHSPVWK